MALGYKVTVKPPHERRDYISSQLPSSTGTYTSYEVYEGTPTQLPIVRVPLNLPIYRTANGRTQTQQLAHIADKNLEKDYSQRGKKTKPFSRYSTTF